MEFINNPKLQHSFFKDVIRINYQNDMPPQLISDYGYTYIMFVYGRIDAYNFKNQQVEVPKALVKGTGDFFNIQAFKESSWLTFELPNHVLYNITQIDSVKNRNTFFDLSNYIGKEKVEVLYENLEDINDVSEIIHITDKYLSEFYKDWGKKIPSVEIVDYILSKKGMLSVKELTDKFPYSERNLERLFSKEVGASPYRFICLVRFNFIIRELENQKHEPLNDLIKKYNYYDQSHFEKDFKKFLGQSIKEYKNEYNPLLTNALARSYLKK